MEIPQIGLGTYQLKNNTSDAIINAINCGYRAIDTATLYRNEKIVGNTVRKLIQNGTVKRDDLFITTKVLGYKIKIDKSLNV